MFSDLIQVFHHGVLLGRWYIEYSDMPLDGACVLAGIFCVTLLVAAIRYGAFSS